MMNRKNYVVLFATVLVVILTACGNPTPAPEKESTGKTDSAARTVWSAQRQPCRAGYSLAPFDNANKHYRISEKQW
jgi:hypothetical protein